MLRRALTAIGCLLPLFLVADVNLVPVGGLTRGTVYGVTRTPITVSGQPFTQAVRLQTVTQPAHSYDAGFVLATGGAVSKGEVIAGSVWLRRLNPTSQPAYTTFNFEKAGPAYDKSHSTTWPIESSTWVQLRFAFTAFSNYPAGAAQVSFHLGFQPQTIELGGFQLTNYANQYPLSAFPNDITYAGRDPAAPWRAEAAARIETYRKADLTIAVHDLNGDPVPGAQVEIQQTRHAFGFGSALDGARLLGRSGTVADRIQYQDFVTNWFNQVVLENDLKWPQWENSPGTAVSALAWLRGRGIQVRGHNLLWPGTAFLPANVPPLFTDPTALRARIDGHFVDILGSTAGACFEWDILNEPLHEKSVENVLGRQDLAEWFKRARTLEPGARRFLNEYDNLESATRDGTLALRNLINDLIARGAPIDGVGLQSHFGGFLTSPTEVYERLKLLTPEGGGPDLRLAVTEFDVNVSDEAIQADYLRDFFTIVFSHPRVERLLMWGFWEGQHWIPQAALVRRNWQLKPNGVQFTNLVFRDWWTHTNLVADSAGKVSIRGFKGDYRIRVTSQGAVQTQETRLTGTTAIEVGLAVSTPRLGATYQSGSLVLRWPATVTGFQVQRTANLSSPRWENLLLPASLVGDHWEAVLTPDTPPSFYRLFQ